MNALASLSSALIAGVSPVRVHGQIACEYEIIATIAGPTCGPIGQRGLIPAAMSPNGLYVTGYHDRCDGIDYDAFIWVGPPPGARITIPRPPGVIGARGVDVNDSGVVTGTCRFSEGGIDRGFVWKHATGQWITLEPPQSQMWIVPTAINNAGTMVGYRSIRNDIVPREAFIWNESTGFQGLGVMIGPSSGARDISESGIVVGWTGSNNPSLVSNNIRAFVWQNASATVLGAAPGAVNSIAKSVDSRGRVTIQAKTQSNPVILVSSYFYDAGTMSTLPTPAGFDRTFPSQSNGAALIVGGASNSATGGVFHACIWFGNQVALIEDIVAPSQSNFGIENSCAGVSESGDILLAGRATPNVEVGFMLRPVATTLGDTNCDHHVNIDDLLNVINTWGHCANCLTDFDHSSVVDIDDLLTVINQWSP